MLNVSQFDTRFALVGHKSDLEAERKVSAEEGEEFATSRKMMWFEASAKTGHQVYEVFHAIANDFLKNCSSVALEASKKSMKLQSTSVSRGVKLSVISENERKRRKGCNC